MMNAGEPGSYAACTEGVNSQVQHRILTVLWRVPPSITVDTEGVTLVLWGISQVPGQRGQIVALLLSF